MLFDVYDFLKRGHEVNEETFRLELFKLLTCLLADESFCKLANDNPDCALGKLRKEFMPDEPMGLLISTAVKARLYDEYYDFIFNRLGGECGKLNWESGRREVLKPREACNKIIHAKYHVWDVMSLHGALKPTIRLYGTHREQKWEAELDVIKYVHYCTAATFADKKYFYQRFAATFESKTTELQEAQGH